LGPLGLQFGQVGFQALGALGDVQVALLGDVLLFQVHLVLQARQVLVPAILVHPGDHRGGEVDDLLQVLRRQVQQVAEAARHALEVPDVGDGGSQFDVPHPLAADLGTRDFHTTAFTDDALEPDTLVLSAVALPVPGGAEDLLAEEAVLLGLEGAVVDGLRLLDFTVRPVADLVRGRQTNSQLVEDVDVEQFSYFLRWITVWNQIRSLRARRRCAGAPSARLRSLRRCSRRDDGTGRYRALRRRGRPPHRCRAS